MDPTGNGPISSIIDDLADLAIKMRDGLKEAKIANIRDKRSEQWRDVWNENRKNDNCPTDLNNDLCDYFSQGFEGAAEVARQSWTYKVLTIVGHRLEQFADFVDPYAWLLKEQEMERDQYMA